MSERQIISNLWTKMKADNKETFLCMCDNKLFEFQWQILRAWLEKECFGPGFVSISPLILIIRESYKIYLSKLHVIKKYVALLIYGLIMKTLSLIFCDKKAKSKKKKKKNVIIIRVSNLVKQELWLMDA